MATCYPDYRKVSQPFKSPGEERVYWSFYENLDDDFHVFHSVSWISKSTGREARDGETDFLVCHPRLGLQVIEVKGGGISLDYTSGQWTSTDRFGTPHKIGNPFQQAARGKFSILEKLKEHPDWRRLNLGRIPVGHAVIFPDIVGGSRLRGPDAPPEIIGDSASLSNPVNWITSLFSYWSRVEGSSGGGTSVLGPQGADLVRRVFARVVSTRSLLSARIAEEEKKRIELTERQMSVLDFLQRQRRVIISGGAGTGKTLIAREKALRLANEGFRTLLTCYNRSLADHVRETIGKIQGLDVANFHQLCDFWVKRTKGDFNWDVLGEAQRDYPGYDLYDHHYPIALSYALEKVGPQYDAIVIDEAQDFREEFWMPIDLLLSDSQTSPLYLFLDENQDVYTRSSKLPLSSEPIVLDRNCRNTAIIHNLAYKYYRGQPVEGPSIVGDPVSSIVASTEDRQASEIVRLVARLIMEEGFRAEDIGVLIGDKTRRSEFEGLLGKFKLPKGAKWGRLESYGPGWVTVDTVARFKGLERPVVILWGLNTLPKQDRIATLYVGMSRAKSLLYLCGTATECATLLPSTAAAVTSTKR